MGWNFVLTGTQGEVGVSLKKKNFFFGGGGGGGGEEEHDISPSI